MRPRDRQEDAASKTWKALEGWRGKLEGHSEGVGVNQLKQW